MKDYSCPSRLPADTAAIERITLIGVFINIFLSVVKFVLGVLGASQALVADAFHSFSDLGTDIVLLVGLRFWSKPADEDHPYGHRRIETMVTLIISLALLGVAVIIGYTAITTISEKHFQQPGWIAFWAAILSIISKEFLYRWTMVVGRQVKSSAVMANAWHHRTDSLSSIPVAVVIALSAVNPRWAYLDHVGAFGVSLFIFYAAWGLLSVSFLEIIDTGVSKKERNHIRSIALATPGVRSVHAIRTRRVGSGWFVDLHIQVDPEASVRAGHRISGVVKYNLLEQGPNIVDVIVHLEPDE